MKHLIVLAFLCLCTVFYSVSLAPTTTVDLTTPALSTSQTAMAPKFITLCGKKVRLRSVHECINGGCTFIRQNCGKCINYKNMKVFSCARPK
jgi:hypothetical protein